MFSCHTKMYYILLWHYIQLWVCGEMYSFTVHEIMYKRVQQQWVRFFKLLVVVCYASFLSFPIRSFKVIAEFLKHAVKMQDKKYDKETEPKRKRNSCLKPVFQWNYEKNYFQIHYLWIGKSKNNNGNISAMFSPKYACVM